jgi:LysM repeat protein
MSRHARVLCVVVVLGVLMLATAASVQADGTYHRVRRGDTLYSLGRLYGTSASAIAAANNLANPNLIYVGQLLYIPTYWSPPPVSPDIGTSWWQGWAAADPEPSAVGPAGTCASWLRCLSDYGCDFSTARAICRDGACSCWRAGYATCAGHGGVRCWVAQTYPPAYRPPYVYTPPRPAWGAPRWHGQYGWYR